MRTVKNKERDNDIDEVLMALVYITDLTEMQRFCDDLLTKSELDTVSSRWKAIRLLAAGISYRKIERATHMSSATVARLAKSLAKRSGGFRMMLSKISG